MENNLSELTSAAKRIPTLHAPERGEDETFAQYKARRAASSKAVKLSANPINVGRYPGDFVLHRASEEKQLRRKLVRMSGGIRAHKRQERNANRFAQEFA